MRVTAVGVAALCLLAPAPGGAARAEGLNNFFAGINGIATAPADPVMMALKPPAAFDELPGPMQWSKRPLGAIAGVLFCAYRIGMGAFDVALTPFWIFPTLSPEAHWDLIPGWTIEYP